jgi:hypothetical protein
VNARADLEERVAKLTQWRVRHEHVEIEQVGTVGRNLLQASSSVELGARVDVHHRSNYRVVGGDDGVVVLDLEARLRYLECFDVLHVAA